MLVGLLAFLAALALLGDLPSLNTNEATRTSLTLFIQIALLLLISILIFLGWKIATSGDSSQNQMDFMYKMTHELQTPVASIHLASDMLGTPSVAESPERMRKYVRIVKEEALRMQWHIDNVLHIARAKNQTLLLKLEKTQIDDLIGSLLERYENSVQMELNARNSNVAVDRQHFINVIHNLVDNALKYSPDHSSVRISTQQSGDRIVVSVRDQGVGIAKEQQKKIFDNFYRIPDNAASVKGFGLGLSYVQQIVQAHQWQLELISQPGQGSDFRIIIPAVLPNQVRK